MKCQFVPRPGDQAICQFCGRLEREGLAECRAPSLATKALNFVVAVARHAGSGFAKVSNETYEGRLAACLNCPWLSKRGMACEKCGCPVEKKARWASESCPEGRWPLKTTEEGDKPSSCGCSKSTSTVNSPSQ